MFLLNPLPSPLLYKRRGNTAYPINHMTKSPFSKGRFRGILEVAHKKKDFESWIRPKSSSLLIEDTFLMVIF